MGNCFPLYLEVPWQPEDLPSILHSRRILTMCKVCVKIFLCVVMATGIDAIKENPTKNTKILMLFLLVCFKLGFLHYNSDLEPIFDGTWPWQPCTHNKPYENRSWSYIYFVPGWSNCNSWILGGIVRHWVQKVHHHISPSLDIVKELDSTHNPVSHFRPLISTETPPAWKHN